MSAVSISEPPLQASESNALNARPNPMTRREIVNRIGLFLDRRSLLCALFVSHQWHDCLLPLAWATLKLEHHYWSDVLESRGHLVQSLDIVYQKGPSDYGFDLDEHYTNLSSLTISIQPDYDDYDSDSGGYGLGDDRLEDADFLQECTMSLRYLRLHAQTPSGLLDALADCPRLEELHLSNQSCSPNRWLDLFEPLWSRLRVLSISVCAPKKESFYGYRKKKVVDIDFTKIEKRLSRARSTRLKELNLTMNWEHFPATFAQLYLQLIQKSPNLVRLSWDSNGEGEKTAMDYMMDALQSKQLHQQLRSLGLFGEYTNPNLEILLMSTTRLQELDLGSTSFDLDSWKILKTRLPRYLTALTSLSLACCDGVTGAMVLDMLFCFPNLVTLVADYITDLDLMGDTRSWTCGPRLKKLWFTYVQTRDDTMPLFLARISKLEQLEDWSLEERRICDNVGLQKLRKPHFQLTLQNGLGDLMTLRNLRRFRGFSRHGSWSEAEVMWALKHWVSLDDISSVEIDKDIRKKLKERYISVTD